MIFDVNGLGIEKTRIEGGKCLIGGVGVFGL